ncbi:hypothetical protein LCGC14_1761190 [marine sediment metagenome]|uniref:Uncharacterized protein n=1 Tax=marine sediment metagenome TaxID=412755 RepID=A0A0F9HNB8_9ZZZZ
MDSLYAWGMLEWARQGKHPYGGDTAEIYIQHLLPNWPLEPKPPWTKASKILRAVIERFCQTYNVSAEVNGKTIGNWMDNYELLHKCDVRIYNGIDGPKI